MNELTLDDLVAELCRGTRVIFQVRHAERPKMDPDDPTFGDSLPITDEGIRACRVLGAKFAAFKDDAQFYASPLRRTRMTAANIAAGMGIENPDVPTDELLGNGSFFYEDPLEVLKLFKEREFFTACFDYFEKGKLPGLKEIGPAADHCERWMLEHAKRRLFVVATHDCYIAAYLSARGVVSRFSRDNWPRFLDGAAILIDPDGSRRIAFVRSGLSDKICGVVVDK